MNHEHFIQHCLDLALKGLGHVAPNPMVGCVIVCNKKIIGEGYHQQYGEAHAEVKAVNSVADSELLKQSTLYVNLEPCSHFGKTPPCADLILQKKIPRVVIGSYDPNPLVAGKGIARLRDAGVAVTTEVLKSESDFLNRRFITFHTRKRPYIILKWAQSADGFMGLNEPRQFWFTNHEAKQLMHKWRTQEPGILVGRNTVTIDDPELTARLWQGKNPVRIVLDKNLSLAPDKKIFNALADTIVFNSVKDAAEENIRFIKIDFAENVLQQITEQLYSLQIQSVMVEGGAQTLRHFIVANLWNEARVFITPHVLHTGKAAPQIKITAHEECNLSDNRLLVYLNHSV